MTTLLQEADLDGRFRTEIGRIQDAIEKLDKLAAQFTKDAHWPVASQVRQLDQAKRDLDKLEILYSALRP